MSETQLSSFVVAYTLLVLKIHTLFQKHINHNLIDMSDYNFLDVGVSS